MQGRWPSKPSRRKGHTRQTCCHPAQLLPSGQHSILSRTSCSALPWLQRWRGWGCKLWEHTHTLLLAGGSDCHLEMTQLSHCARGVLCLCHATCYVQRNEQDVCCFLPPSILKTVIPPSASNEYQRLLLVQCCWQTYSLSTCLFFLLLCSQRASQQVIHPPPSTSTLCWHTIDHPSPPCPPPTTSADLSTERQQAAASLGDRPSSSWWFTVLLHKLTVGISQCLNTEKPYYSLMRRGSCRMVDAELQSLVVDFLLCRSRAVTNTSSAVVKPACRHFDSSLIHITF